MEQFPDLQKLLEELRVAAHKVTFGTTLTTPLRQRIVGILGDKCTRHNDTIFEITIGLSKEGTIDISHRAAILAILGTDFVRAYLNYQAKYKERWNKMDEKVLGKLFPGGQKTSEADPEKTTSKKEPKKKDELTSYELDLKENIFNWIQNLKYDPETIERLLKFGRDTTWSDTVGRGISRHDAFHSPMLRAVGLNQTKAVAVAELCKTLSEEANIDQLRIDILNYVNQLPPANFSNLHKGINQIYYGSPGTGKSHFVKSLFKEEQIIRVTFHPEYTHSDFVGSYRPVVGFEDEPQITGYDEQKMKYPVNYFAFVAGPFIKAFQKAIENLKNEDKKDKDVCLLIEEINRGHCAAIFGDIFQLLDRKDGGESEYEIDLKPEIQWYFQSIPALQGIEKLYIPKNLSIVATMNTSDQSLFPMDSAFKRRWNWKYVPIDFDEIGQVYLEDTTGKWDWCSLAQTINYSILKSQREDKQIGQWFIKPQQNEFGSYIDPDAFVSKCLFYLWHDVFNGELFSDDSPFLSDGSLAGFHSVKRAFESKGLAGIFKEGFRTEKMKFQQPPLESLINEPATNDE